jgi:hypothetical protein
MNGFGRDNSRQMGGSKEDLVQKRKNNKFDDNLSTKSRENDNDSLSSHRSKTSAISQESVLSKSIFQSPEKREKKSKYFLIRKSTK